MPQEVAIGVFSFSHMLAISRSADGLTATRVCSTANLRETQIDENPQEDVAILCGNMR